MPNIKSAKKRLRTSEKERVRNKSRISAIKTSEKKFRAAIAEENKDLAQTQLLDVFSRLDRAVKANTIHRNKADRKKSQLRRLLNALS